MFGLYSLCNILCPYRHRKNSPIMVILLCILCDMSGKFALKLHRIINNWIWFFDTKHLNKCYAYIFLIWYFLVFLSINHFHYREHYFSLQWPLFTCFYFFETKYVILILTTIIHSPIVYLSANATTPLWKRHMICLLNKYVEALLIGVKTTSRYDFVLLCQTASTPFWTGTETSEKGHNIFWSY